jgi:tripartite-type tricarboxylate transporter receptor subunit TctC
MCPTRGGTPATTATIAGETAAVFSGTSSAPLIRAGKLRALAVAGAKRSPTFPDLPTIGEFYPGFENSIWLGLFGPTGMPEEVLQRLRTEVRKALESPDVKQKLVGAGSLETLLLSPQDFNALIRRDYERFGKLIRDIGVKAD